MKQSVAIFIIFLLVSCSNNSGNEKNSNNKAITAEFKTTITILDSNVYDDIDLFKLEGVKKIKHPTTYPYIIIQDNGSFQKRIVYKNSNKNFFEILYKFENKSWTTSYEYKTDTGFCKVFEYIKPNKIIELEYEGTYDKKDYHLHDVSLIQKDSSITYGFGGDKGINIPPNINNFEIVKKCATTFFLDKIYIENSKLVKTWTRIDTAHGYSFYSDTSCYKANNHSWFWWRYFTGEKIKCK